MMIQAELKQRAYASGLKSRALSILIYLIDRSNKELTCFPAIPTMAKELHIGISTVKRALHELVDAGFIQKDSRFRDNNRGQTSNLYTLIFSEGTPNPTPEQEHNPEHGDDIELTGQTAPASAHKPEHITFVDIFGAAEAQEKTEPVPLKTITSIAATPQSRGMSRISHVHPPTHIGIFGKQKLPPMLAVTIEKAGRFLPCHSFSPSWTGAESILIPP